MLLHKGISIQLLLLFIRVASINYKFSDYFNTTLVIVYRLSSDPRGCMLTYFNTTLVIVYQYKGRCIHKVFSYFNTTLVIVYRRTYLSWT